MMPPSKIVKKITLFYLVQTSLLGQLSYRLGYQISAGKEKWTDQLSSEHKQSTKSY